MLYKFGQCREFITALAYLIAGVTIVLYFYVLAYIIAPVEVYKFIFIWI